jgi:hypothetical protein
MADDKNFDPKTTYIVSQVAHITCKKDHHEILVATISDSLSTEYETLQSSRLVFIQPPSPEAKLKALYISKYAMDIMLEEVKSEKMPPNILFIRWGRK